MSAALLEVRGVSICYGAVVANDSVDMTIRRGQFVGLIGPNGAGKTTLVDGITGFTPVTKGTVKLDGQDIGHLPPHRRTRRGIARTFQSVELFDDLSVWDNCLVAGDVRSGWSLLLDALVPRTHSRAREQVAWALDVVGLGEHATSMPAALSQGQRKLAAVARSLANRPSLVVLDEPAAGLDSMESALLGSQLRGLLDQDITVLMIDHDMDLVSTVCDEVYVLDFGRMIAHGTPSEVLRHPDVAAAYLGDAGSRRVVAAPGHEGDGKMEQQS